MLYSDYDKAFATRLKSRDYKVMFNSALQMKKNPVTSDFEFHRTSYRYTQNTITKKWQRTASTTMFATVSPSNVLTFHAEEAAASDNSLKNLLYKMAHLNLYSNTSKFALYEHKLRVTTRRSSRDEASSVPFTTGFQYDLNSDKVIWSAPDVRKVTNREASKPINEYVRKVMTVMKVMLRLGAFTADTKASTWRDRSQQVEKLRCFDMSDEALALFAEAAYTSAEAVTTKPNKYVYEYDEARQQSTRTERNPAEVDALFQKNLVANASKKLRAILKDKHGGYDVVDA